MRRAKHNYAIYRMLVCYKLVTNYILRIVAFMMSGIPTECDNLLK